MEALIRGAKLLGLGEYDLAGVDGKNVRYLDLYDESAATPAEAVVRMSLTADCAVPESLSMGDLLDVWFRVRNTSKVVRGEDRDRALGHVKLQAVNIEPAKSGAVTAPGGFAEAA